MSLTDDIEASTRRPGGTCTIPGIIEALGAEGAELVAALASDVPASAISRALTLRGHSIGVYTLARHRRRDCRCPR